MARESERSLQPWGTLEELLLACAVQRYGTKSWDLIAVELQNRISSAFTILSFTPQNCINKFNDLKRRFLSQNDTDSSSSSSSLVDELRKIRVAELREGVQRSDVSIVSLELKVKRLAEERDRSVKEEADLERKKMLSPDIVAGDDDGRSFNESNSTSQKGELVKKKNNPPNDAVEDEEEGDEEARNKTGPVPVQTGSDPDRVCNGKLDKGNNNNNNNNNNEVVKNGVKTSGLGESNGVRDSVSESKRGEPVKAVSKQSSDVQSSASLSMMKRRRSGGVRVGVGGAGGISSGEEAEVSPATNRVSAVKSVPLLKFLGIIRSHRLGWVFERRLRSQETERYKNLIRQHMDLQTIQSRLNKGAYDCIQKFFRDLLLLFNNATVFYKNNSQEQLAAQELRAIVWKEMADYKLRKPPLPMTVKSEPEEQPVSFSKTNKSPTMVVCGRRRSSIRAISENASKRGERKERDVDEKPKVNEKKMEGSFVGAEEKGIRKQRSNERSVSGRRNTRTIDKSVEIKHEYGINELSSHDSLEDKIDKRETMVRKRQGAASFLKRMKQNSPSEVLDNDDDVSEDESGDDDKGEKQKKGRGRKREARTDRVTRSSRGRGAREETGKVRRGVGRPPKRQAAPESTGKRARDNGENEVGVGGTGGRPRKRSRR